MDNNIIGFVILVLLGCLAHAQWTISSLNKDVEMAKNANPPEIHIILHKKPQPKYRAEARDSGQDI